MTWIELLVKMGFSERLRLFAWQHQKTAVPGSVGFAGFDSSLRTTTQTGLSMPHLSGAHANQSFFPACLGIGITS